MAEATARATATLPSRRSTTTNMPKTTLTYKKNSSSAHLRNNTISSYLNSSTRETLKLEFAENTSTYVDTRIDVQQQMRFGKKKKEDVGLSFSSDKYFNGETHEKIRSSRSMHRGGGRRNQRKRNDNNVHPKGVEPEAKPRKRSLAASVFKYWFPCELKKMNIKRFYIYFGCKCTCSDAKSVDIEKCVLESKSSSRNRNKKVNYEGVGECKEIRNVRNQVFRPNPFSLVLDKYTQPESSSEDEDDEISSQKFDSLSSELQNSSASPVLHSEVEDLAVETQVKENAQKPLEVFGSPISVKNFPSRVTDIQTALGSDGMIYDADSDSSSDLFEIKNIKFSTLSDSNGEKTPRLSKNKTKGLPASTTTPKKITSVEKNPIGMSMQKRRDDILLSCRSYKAVNVARNNTYNIAKETQSDPQLRRRMDSATPVSENRTYHARHRDFKVITHVTHSMRRNSFS